MDPISHLQQLIGVLRQQVDGQLEKGGRRSPVVAPKANKSSQPSNASSIDRIRDTLIERVKTISPDHAGRSRKLNRLFLEVVLVTEFGEQILADTAFAMLVDDMQATMEANPFIQAQLTQLTNYLTSIE